MDHNQKDGSKKAQPIVSIRFLIYGLLIQTIILSWPNIISLYQSRGINVQKSSAVSQERKGNWAPVIEWSYKDVVPRLKNNEGKKTLLYVYGSWCTHCHEMMPTMVDLLKKGTFKDFNVVFLSTDANAEALGIYLNTNGYATYSTSEFPIYLVRAYYIDDLKKELQSTGSIYRGAVPYIGVFDSNGKVTIDDARLNAEQIVDLIHGKKTIFCDEEKK